MHVSLQGKNAVLCGGGGALGSAVARTFAAAGATVHLVGRTREPLEAVAADIGDAAHVAVLERSARTPCTSISSRSPSGSAASMSAST